MGRFITLPSSHAPFSKRCNFLFPYHFDRDYLVKYMPLYALVNCPNFSLFFPIGFSRGMTLRYCRQLHWPKILGLRGIFSYLVKLSHCLPSRFIAILINGTHLSLEKIQCHLWSPLINLVIRSNFVRNFILHLTDASFRDCVKKRQQLGMTSELYCNAWKFLVVNELVQTLVFSQCSMTWNCHGESSNNDDIIGKWSAAGRDWEMQ